MEKQTKIKLLKDSTETIPANFFDNFNKAVRVELNKDFNSISIRFMDARNFGNCTPLSSEMPYQNNENLLPLYAFEYGKLDNDIEINVWFSDTFI